MATDWLNFLIQISEKDNMFKGLITQFTYQCKIKNLAERTIETYGEILALFYQYLKQRKLDFSQVDRSIIQDYIVAQKGKVSDHTINSRIRTLKLFFNYLHEEGFLENGNPMQKISFIKADKKIKPVLSPEDIERLLKIPNKKTSVGFRDFCIIYVFWDTLIRLSELINIKIDDVDLKEGIIKVYGKGRKERFVPIGIKLIKYLHQYLIRYRSKIDSPYFFCTTRGTPLAISTLEHKIKKYGRKIGLYVTPHLIRHSGATWWIKSGGQPMYLQNLMGHTSMSVTQNYIHLANINDMKKHHNQYSLGNLIRV